MSKKWKIFGYQTDLEFYDVKTKFKQLLRKITYTWLVQEIICSIISAYMWLVYLTSKKVFINDKIMLDLIKKSEPLIVAVWHNRLMMLPFITLKPRKINPEYKMMTLASNHGDGRFVGRVMEKFGLLSILGSTNAGRKASRGISIATLRRLIKGLKNGQGLGITPDGPRGPNQKINGEVINIAKMAQANIVACSYSCSRMKTLKSWDKFKIPLPFSKICFYFDDEVLKVKKSDNESVIKNKLEQRINFAQEQSLKNL